MKMVQIFLLNILLCPTGHKLVWLIPFCNRPNISLFFLDFPDFHWLHILSFSEFDQWRAGPFGKRSSDSLIGPFQGETNRVDRPLASWRQVDFDFDQDWLFPFLALPIGWIDLSIFLKGPIRTSFRKNLTTYGNIWRIEYFKKINKTTFWNKYLVFILIQGFSGRFLYSISSKSGSVFDWSIISSLIGSSVISAFWVDSDCPDCGPDVDALSVVWRIWSPCPEKRFVGTGELTSSPTKFFQYSFRLRSCRIAPSVTPNVRAIDAFVIGQFFVWFSQMQIICRRSVGLRTDLLLQCLFLWTMT